jgi:hypothetical protein
MYTCIIQNHPLSGDEFTSVSEFIKAQSVQRVRKEIVSEGFPLYDEDDLMRSATGDYLCPFTHDVALLKTQY